MYSASVIIPVYNAEKTLRKCVEALCYGEERNLEIILIDDCSKDNSWELCAALHKEFQNVRCFKNEKNSGVSFSRNQGLARATAPFLLFVDSDDWTSSQYAKKLLSIARMHNDCLAICGYTHIDKVANIRKMFLQGTDGTDIVDTAELFSLFDRILLQQLWNKIFRRDIIEEHQIRFDETQTMGEDFQFVLDYLEAAEIKQCVVLNEPLYYYIRWNNSSLMSKFGFTDCKPEFDRMEQLAGIVGAGAEVRRDEMIARSKWNYVYHIVRNPHHSKEEKLEAIERIIADGKAGTYYRQQKRQHIKEQLAVMAGKVKLLPSHAAGRLQRGQLQKKIARAVSGVNAQGITFISQNCIGGVLYHDLGMQFLSPTINTFIPEPGFVKLVLNLRHYMEQELVMRWGETYPIGMLEDVEIHFMHYDTCQEAEESWNKRKARINWNKIFVIGTDRDSFDEAVYEQWKQIKYPKILFTAHSEFTEAAVYYPQYAADGQIGDLIGDRSFYKSGTMIKFIQELS